MVRVGISVEGLTEELFVKKVLAPYLGAKGVYMSPVSMGGDVNIDRIRSELQNISFSYDYVTTLYDFYGFKKLKAGETKESLEKRILDAVHENVKRKLVPYVQMYEFEGLLFSSPEAISLILLDSALEDWARGILDEFENDPEKINNSTETAPSKRLLSHTMYRKTTHGPNIAGEIGVDGLREKCAGFDAWMARLERLALKVDE